MPPPRWFGPVDVYETATRLYAVGRLRGAWRILKLDRTLGRDDDVQLTDDGAEYTRAQAAGIVATLQSAGGGCRHVCRAHALLGCVRFAAGHYLVAVVQATRVATVGRDAVLRVDETRLIPVANDALATAAKPPPDEARYVAAFQAIALQQDLYYSLTYDVARTLQHNVLAQGVAAGRLCPPCRAVAARCMGAVDEHVPGGGMFTWNAHLIATAVRGGASPAWFVPIIQGFVAQIKLAVIGRPVFLTLIARRSRRFAGARFLKRGGDAEGFVANEVETEQIVFDGSHTAFPDLDRIHTATSKVPSNAARTGCLFCHGHGLRRGQEVTVPYPPGPIPRAPPFSSFVQHRGSIPLYWSQDNSSMQPKPPITLNIRDPYQVCASRHFDRMLQHYGSPIIVFNLIKTKERVHREAILGDEFEQCIQYLNQFLPAAEHIQYTHVDMSREAKRGNHVIDMLEQHAERMVDQVGFFSCTPEPILQARMRDDGKFILARVQQGCIRTNCIDCLDRTNAAAFVIGKVALARQLVHLGILKSPSIPFDSEAIDLLTDLYQAHGDAIAMQYGGSMLVNTMRTYRMPSDLVSQSRDILETIKRFYSNSFTDAEKQDAIDIFLGVFRPDRSNTGSIPNHAALKELTETMSPPQYTKWRTQTDPQSEPSSSANATTSADVEFDEDGGDYFSLANLAGIDCPSTHSATPFKVHPPHDTNPIFDLGGLKKWLSARNADGPGFFLRERTSSVSSFFGGSTPFASIAASSSASDLPTQPSVPQQPQRASNNNDDSSSKPTQHEPFPSLSGTTRQPGEMPIGRTDTAHPGSPALLSIRIENSHGFQSDLHVADPPVSPLGLLHPSAPLLASGIPVPAQAADPRSASGNKQAKKKPIEVLVNKLLNPTVTASQQREYALWVQQIDAPLQLTASIPLVDPSSPDAASANPHIDYACFARHCQLGRGEAEPYVTDADTVVYDEYVRRPHLARVEVTDADADRYAAYESWVTTGRIKLAAGAKKLSRHASSSGIPTPAVPAGNM